MVWVQIACLSRFYTIPFDKCKIELSSNSMFFKTNLPDLSSVAVRFSRYLFHYFCLSAQFLWRLTVHLEIKCRDWKHCWLRLCAPLYRPSALSPFIWVVYAAYRLLIFALTFLLRRLCVWRQPSCFSVKALACEICLCDSRYCVKFRCRSKLVCPFNLAVSGFHTAKTDKPCFVKDEKRSIEQYRRFCFLAVKFLLSAYYL